jgi:hypothetical protein
VVTKLSDGRGQTTIKGKEIDAEWEALVKRAAGRVGQTVAAFVVDHTRSAAQAILTNTPVGPPALPMRIEDVAGSLAEQVERLAERQAADLAQLAAEQRDRLDRQARRGRWRR